MELLHTIERSGDNGHGNQRKTAEVGILRMIARRRDQSILLGHEEPSSVADVQNIGKEHDSARSKPHLMGQALEPGRQSRSTH